MPPPQKIFTSEGISGVLNLKAGKAGRRGVAKWKRKFAVMRQDTLHLYEGQDENGRGMDESHTVYLSKYKECIHIVDKKGKKKGGFALVPADSTYEQWLLSCDDTNEQEKWINQLNQAISGDVITIINFNLDEVTVETPALKHLGKSRPKCKGKRAPSKRPRMDMYDSQNGECSSDDMEVGVTTLDLDTPAKKARSDLAPTSPSPITTPDESKAGGAKAFFRGIGLKVSSALGRQKSTGAKTPQSPEPGVKEEAPLLDIPPEERMSLSALLRTLQNIETTSGTIINKAAALRVLFQGSAADSAGLGKPAREVEMGLEGMTTALEHLSLAENLQLKVKENEERERLIKEEIAREKKEKEEARMRQEEEQRQKEAEQRRRDEEEQELQDEEDRQKEEDRLKEEEEARKAKEEALRLAEEAHAEEEKIWESGDEKNESAEMVDQDEPSSPDNTEPMIVENGKKSSVAEDEAAEETSKGGDTTENGGDKGDVIMKDVPKSPTVKGGNALDFNIHV